MTSSVGISLLYARFYWKFCLQAKKKLWQDLEIYAMNAPIYQVTSFKFFYSDSSEKFILSYLDLSEDLNSYVDVKTMIKTVECLRDFWYHRGLNPHESSIFYNYVSSFYRFNLSGLGSLTAECFMYFARNLREIAIAINPDRKDEIDAILRELFCLKLEI